MVIRAPVGPEHIWAFHLSIFFLLSIVIWAFFYNWAFLSEHYFPAEHFHLSIIVELSISIWAFFVIWVSKSEHVLSPEHFYLSIFCHLSIFIWAVFLPAEHFPPCYALTPRTFQKYPRGEPIFSREKKIKSPSRTEWDQNHPRGDASLILYNPRE